MHGVGYTYVQKACEPFGFSEPVPVIEQVMGLSDHISFVHSVVKLVIFTWGIFGNNMDQTVHIGVIFMNSVLFMYFTGFKIRCCKIFFALRKFWQSLAAHKCNRGEKSEYNPYTNISTFTVIVKLTIVRKTLQKQITGFIFVGTNFRGLN